MKVKVKNCNNCAFVNTSVHEGKFYISCNLQQQLPSFYKFSDAKKMLFEECPLKKEDFIVTLTN